MDLTALTASDPTLSATQRGLGAADQTALDKTAFMELLVAQLANQDPLEPAANEEFVAQLANFSSLEQLENLNGSILAMIGLNQSNALLSQLTQSSALIGQEVTWQNPETGLSQSGLVESVRIEEGIAFLRIDGRDVPLTAVTEIQAGTESVEGGTGDQDGGEVTDETSTEASDESTAG